MEVIIFVATLSIALAVRGIRTRAWGRSHQEKVSQGPAKKAPYPWRQQVLVVPSNSGAKRGPSTAAAHPSTKSLSDVDAVKLVEKICEAGTKGHAASGGIVLFVELRTREGFPEAIKRAGKTPEELYTAVAQSAVRSGRVEVLDMAFDRAVTFFESMLGACKPSVRACMTILRVYARQEDWAKTLETLRHMQRLEVPLDSLVFNVMLATGVATNHAKEAEELLEEVLSYSPPVVDVVSYNTVIKGYAITGQAEKAMLLIHAMRKRGVWPNAITYNTAMDAAVRAGQPDEAWKLLKVMRMGGLRPDRFTCSILSRGCGDGVSFSRLRE